jgi:uracil-DNA glycosylase
MESLTHLNHLEKQESLDVLNYQIRSCERCKLSLTRKHALPGEGNIDARLMIVALSPGAKENLANRMFVGPSGQVLEKLFLASGISREMIFMTNLVKCMLPGNRKPEKNEIELCGAFLDDEISIIKPEVIAPLGHYAARAVLQKFHSDAQVTFGELLHIGGQKIYPLSHPAALLYNPSYEADTIEKYKKLKTFL